MDHACETPPSGELGQQGFERLVAGLMPELRRYALWLSRDPHLADDLVQETLLRAWRGREGLREPEAAKSWLLTILKREHCRRFERPRGEEVELDPETLPCQPLHDSSTEAFVVRRALGTLTDDYRDPLLLQVLGGFSTDEIGNMLGITRGAVMTRVFRARQRLREVLVEPDEIAAAAA